MPGDVSSAAFFIVAALTVPGSRLTLTNVGLNPTRSGLINLLEDRRANISIARMSAAGGEAIGGQRNRICCAVRDRARSQ